MNAFQTLLTMMMDLQAPIFTVEYLREMWHGEWTDTYHIVVPDGCVSVIDYAFIRHSKDEYTLIYATNIGMSFAEAMTHYTTKTIRSQGARFTLYGL